MCKRTKETKLTAKPDGATIFVTTMKLADCGSQAV
jgi:hypothetical protein